MSEDPIYYRTKDNSRAFEALEDYRIKAMLPKEWAEGWAFSSENEHSYYFTRPIGRTQDVLKISKQEG